MAENIDVNVNVNTSQANRNLDNLNNRVAALNKSFGALKTAVGGIAFGALINNSLRFAASMVDVSNSTDIALEAVVGFSRAVQANGGDINGAQQALQKFNVTIGEAAEGSAGAQDAFRQVGVSLNDLSTLSQEDLLRKTIQGLNQIKDASLRAKLASELLGKSFRNIDIKGLADQYQSAVLESQKYTSAIRTADQVQNNLEKSITDLTTAILIVMKPIGDLAKSITTNIDSMVRWISAIGELILTLGGLFVIGRIAGAIYNGVMAIRAMYVAIKEARGQIKWLNEGLGVTFKNLKAVIDRIKELGATNVIAKSIGEKLAFIFDTLSKLAIGAAAAAASWLGLTRAFERFDVVKQQQEIDSLVNYIDDLMESSTQAWVQAQQLEEQQRQVTDAFLKQKKAIQGVTEEYQRSNAEQIAAINLQRISIDMSRDEVEVMNAVDEVIKRNEEALRKLRDEKEKLAANDPLISAIDAEIDALEKSLETDKRITAEAVRETQKRVLAQEKLTHVIEQTNAVISQGASLQALQDQLSLVGQYGEELENNLVRLDVQRELESTLNALAVRALELEQQRVQLGEARYQQEMNNLLALTDAAYRYADARLEAEKKILDAQRATQENAKLGVEQAMADIAKQFEPYTMAQDAVKQGWNRVSDALDTFVETGKLNFKDLARSILADLAKMIAKALVFKAISGIAGAFGLSLPGLAKGGPAKGGQPYIVGEKGPELFIPKGSGTVVPNNKLGMAAKGTGTGEISAPITNNYITNNINAVDAKSVAQLFAENRKTLLGAVATAQREMPYMA